MFLRQSTASQEILLGPFLDPADGDTVVTSLTIANTDIKLFKAGASAQASKNSGGATHDANGMYVATLDATDTNTVGNLEVNVHVAGALAIKREYTVLTAAVYDALIAGSSTLDVGLTTAVADSVPAVGSRPSIAQAVLMMTRFLTTRRVASGSTMTAYKEDASTASMTFSLNDVSNPTDVSRLT